MTPLEAYVSVFNDIFNLKDLGINVEFNKAVSANNTEIVQRFKDDPKRIPSEHWVYVTFSNLDEDKRNQIIKTEFELGEFGILFDTDSTVDTHNWSLDWSFIHFYYENDNDDWKNRKTIMNSKDLNIGDCHCFTCDLNKIN